MTKSLDNGGSLAVDRSSAGGRTLPLEGIVPPIRCCAGGSRTASGGCPVDRGAPSRGA